MGIGQKKGFRHTAETKARIGATQKGRVPLAIHIKRTCPTCAIEMGIGNMGRHAPACAARSTSPLLRDMTVRQLKTMRRKLRPYGMTPEDYSEMWVAQNGVCLICEEANSSGRMLAVDHCHETKVVRGLLCDRCNHLVGCAKDDPEILRRAIVHVMTRGLDRYG